MVLRLILFFFTVLFFSGLDAQVELPPEEADKHYTNLLVFKIQQQQGRILPRKQKDMPPEQRCLLFFPDQLKNPKFSINARSYPIRITLPHHFNSWAFRKECILPFVHAHLTARTGLRTPLRDIWISAAILHEILEPGILYGAAGYGVLPYARTMTAHGFSPSPENILNSSMDDFYGEFTSAARMEWCELLMRQALKKIPLLEKEIMQNPRLTPAQKFENIIFPEQEEQKNTVFNRSGMTLDEWFFANNSSVMLGRGIPAAVPWIEEQFREILHSLQAVLKTPDPAQGQIKSSPAPKQSAPNSAKKTGSKKKTRKMPRPRIITANDKIKESLLSREELQAIANAETKLNRLAMDSPDLIALKLYRYIKALRQFRDHPTDKNNLRLLRQEETEVYVSLTERADLERALKAAEQRLIPPGIRFALTLQTVRPQRSDLPLLKKAEKLMDHFEKDFMP